MHRRDATWLVGGSILGAVLLSSGFQILKPSLIRAIGILVPPGKSLNRTYFFSTSNVRQQVKQAKCYNVKEEATDVADWRMYTPVDPARNAYIYLIVHKDRPRLIFYPRVSRPDCSVTVYFQDGYKKLKLFESNDRGQGWTEIGMQYALDLSCAGYGDPDQEVDIPLVVVLKGKWSQLWFKGNDVFF